MPRPVIGITTRRLFAEGRWVEGVDSEYPSAVAEAGGLPVLVSCRPREEADTLLSTLDGLLVSGGGDVDPRFYREDPTSDIDGVDRDRDEWELELVSRALDAGIPLLGICRGCQVLNVARGGTLVQHLPDVTPVQHLVVAPRDRISHYLSIRTGTQLAEIVGTDDLAANTIHHQAVKALGIGLRIGSRADDGVIESIELDGGLALGVQWHPENLLRCPRQRSLFDWLVRAATRAGHGSKPGHQALAGHS